MSLLKTLLLSLTFIFLNHNCFSQDNINLPTSDFSTYVKSILEDTSGFWKEYPKPPPLTNEVLVGLSEELKNDSVKYYFDHLSVINLNFHRDYRDGLTFYKNHQYIYSILALAAHWNPDVRVISLNTLNFLLKIRKLVNVKQETKLKYNKDEKIVAGFLIYLLENNPLIISGSENSTIHEFYISNILWNLDLITGANIVDEKHFSEWYKNDLQFKSVVLKWKEFLTGYK